MSDIVWEEPSGGRAGRPNRKDWSAIAEALRANPGNWAVIDTDISSSSASNYRSGSNRSFPKGDFEFTIRGARNGRAEKLYARYVGSAVKP